MRLRRNKRPDVAGALLFVADGITSEGAAAAAESVLRERHPFVDMVSVRLGMELAAEYVRQYAEGEAKS